MRILVTGSSGFIGVHLARALVSRGHIVCGIDLRSPSMSQIIPFGFDFHPVDVLHRQSLTDLFKIRPFDAIAHLAAGVGPEHVVADPYSTVAVNVEGTHNLLEVAQRYSPKAFVLFTSTSEVYGNSPDRPFNEEFSPLVLGPSRERRWCYAASKLAAEHLVLACGGIVVRVFNTTGPGQSEEYVLPRFVGMALRGEDISLYGDGSQVRCFCHVRSTVAALSLLLESGFGAGSPEGAILGQVFNVGSDHETTIRNLAMMVRNLVNPNLAIKNVPHAQAPAGSLLMDYRRPDLKKIMAVIPWTLPPERSRPTRMLEELINDIKTWKLTGRFE